MKVGVVGAGSFGTALAVRFRERDHHVTLYARDEKLSREIALGSNEKYLPGARFAPGLGTTAVLEDLRGCDALVVAVPMFAYADVVPQCAALSPRSIVSTAKGMDVASHRLPWRVFENIWSGPYGALTGPSFAHELVRGLPTALVLASADASWAQRIQEALSGPELRVYVSDDVAGAELCGAVKNVVAIAAGMAAGLDLGQNAHAALVTRGLYEISRLIQAIGGRSETVAGLAGLGDLVLTCGSTASRNFRFGQAVARGERPADALLAIGTVEGFATTKAVHELAKSRGIDMPIADAVHSVIYRGETPRKALVSLMLRRLKSEVH